MNYEIGVLVDLTADLAGLKKVQEMGLKACQLCAWDPSIWTEEVAANYKKRSAESGVRATGLWTGWPGPMVWDFVEGPETLGIVPVKYRAARVKVLKQGADFAAKLGLPAIITHLGYIPENATDPLFKEVVEVVRDIAEHCKAQGLEFWFETGQETPVTMLRLIQEVGTGNLGINLDPANLISYGKGNPVDSLDVFGKHVKNIHAKDSVYPTDPMKLGGEVRLGEGKVDFPRFLAGLAEVGYDAELIIEREISGEAQRKDIEAGIQYLKSLMGDSSSS